MKLDNEDQIVGNKLAKRLKSLQRVEGCCKTLEIRLQVDKLKTILNLMKLSIGSTIPKSPQYGSTNFSQVTKDEIPFLQLIPQLKELLQKR